MGVTVGIDIGTTSVKAVAADDDGEVLARCRIPHELVAPTPERFEHDPAQAWSSGVLEAWRQVRAGLDRRGRGLLINVSRSIIGAADPGAEARRLRDTIRVAAAQTLAGDRTLAATVVHTTGAPASRTMAESAS